MPGKKKRLAHPMRYCNLRFVITLFSLGFTPAGHAEQALPPRVAAVTSLKVSDLADFDQQPKKIQDLIRSALALTEKNLTYTFASADPANGGMDCSGTIYYLLRKNDLADVPRQSNVICQWVIDKGTWHRTENVTTLQAPAFEHLRPGDLLFWSGTYEHSERALPISHVMLYLGRHKETDKPIAFGASDGRRYSGLRRCGVSVFDFTLPRPESKAAFYGYGTIPGLEPPPAVPTDSTEDPADPQIEIRKAVVEHISPTDS